MKKATWPTAVSEKGWLAVRIGTSTCKGETAFCLEPGWFHAHELPFAIPGARHNEVPWAYATTRPLPQPEHRPHVVYVPQGLKSARDAFVSLHARCLKEGLALKVVTAASTPNLQVIVHPGIAHKPYGLTLRSFRAAALHHPEPHLQNPSQPNTSLLRGRTGPVMSLVLVAGHRMSPTAAEADGPEVPGLRRQQQQGSSANSSVARSRGSVVGGAAITAGVPAAAAVVAVAAANAPLASASVSATATATGPSASACTSGGGMGVSGVVAAAMSAAGGGEAMKGGRVQACFYGYFLPYKPDRDLKPGQPFNVLWKRRLEERRIRCQDQDISAWRDDLHRMGDRLSNGLPLCERAVQLQGYWSGVSSPVGAGPGRLVPGWIHCCQVQTVLPGQIFLYDTKPWWPKPDNPKGTLEPVTSHLQEGFLVECDCSTWDCGKLRARQELKRLREEGVQYMLEVRQGTNLGNGHLGVFAGQAIPSDTYLLEYVGVWLPRGELEKRESVYESAGLHYLYDLDHRFELPGDREARCDSPAAGIGGGEKRRGGGCGGDGGGEGRQRKRRAGWSLAAMAAEEHAHAPAAVDATHLGNVSRFLNHRCEGANVASVKVCMGGLDEAHMTIVVRTLRDITPGEELTLDYQAGLAPREKDRIRAQPEGLVPCKCGAAMCLGVVFPSLDNIMNREAWPGPEKAPRRNTLGVRERWSTLAVPAPQDSSTTSTTTSSGVDDSYAPGGNLISSGGGRDQDYECCCASAAASGNVSLGVSTEADTNGAMWDGEGKKGGCSGGGGGGGTACVLALPLDF